MGFFKKPVRGIRKDGLKEQDSEISEGGGEGGGEGKRRKVLPLCQSPLPLSTRPHYTSDRL